MNEAKLTQLVERSIRRRIESDNPSEKRFIKLDILAGAECERERILGILNSSPDLTAREIAAEILKGA